MTVAELIAILQMQDPARLVVDAEGLTLGAGDVQAVQLRRILGTPAWGDQGATRYARDDDGDVAGLEIGC